MKLSEVISARLEKEKITYRDIAQKAGLSDTTVFSIADGSTENPGILTVLKIAKALDINPVDLLISCDLISKEDVDSYFDRQQQAKKLQEDLKVFRLGELFCGPGGLATGALNAHVDGSDVHIVHQWANDYDEETCSTYRHNICHDDEADSVICGDVRELDMDKLENIDALAFGFPCNDYSVVGEQKGLSGTYGPLYTYGVKALKKFRPKWFLAENVSGLSSANSGKAFKKILKEMEEADYVLVPNLYKFEEYGIPQARHRIIIVGIRSDIAQLGYEYKVPSPELYKGVDNTCRNAIENPPIPEDAFNNELTKQSDRVVERLTYIKPGQNAFTADLPDHLKLAVKGAKISQIYKRLDPNKPSYTVTGSGGGGTHMYHWDEPRALTNRERARLQTFPDDFEFLGSKESVRKQIGMAVPCKGAQIIFEAILKTFAKIDYPSVAPNIKE